MQRLYLLASECLLRDMVLGMLLCLRYLPVELSPCCTVLAQVLSLSFLFEEWFNGKKSLDNFVGAYDVLPEDHIRVQATIQKYMDSCISKTINLPATSTPEQFSQAALDYAPYLKGLTVYRAGSKGNEPLEAIPLSEENIAIYMKQDKEASVQTGEACSLAGGDCS